MIRIGIFLAGLAALSACAPAGSNTGGNTLAEVCAAQADMAQAGRTDGRPQTITCPE
jgi:hypothetical protein